MKRSRTNVAGVVVALVAMVAAIALGGPLASTAQAAAGTGYTLKKLTLVSGRSVVARWNPCQTAITYRVNLAGLPKAKRSAMLKQIKTGFATLSAANGIAYRYTGTTKFVPRRKNTASAPAEIVVAAVSKRATDLPFGKNTLGYGGMLWSSWSGSRGEGAAVVRGYVVLSPAGIAGLKPGFGKGLTQGNLILHELAHATGLEHSSSRTSLMNPLLTSSTPNGFSTADRAGLKRLGRQAGCISISPVVSLKDLS